MKLEELSKLDPRSKREALILVFDHLLKVLEQKDNDYSPENIRLYGEVGVAVRLGDKVLRLKSLVVDRRDAQVSDESVNDTLLDVCGYGFIGLLLRLGWWDLPFKEES